MAIQISQKTIDAVAVSLSPLDWKTAYWQSRALRVIRATLIALLADKQITDPHKLADDVTEPSWPGDIPELKFRTLPKHAVVELERQRQDAFGRFERLGREIARQRSAAKPAA